jgi:hypothetical protein
MTMKSIAQLLVRVIDESGEDYLYPLEYFMRIDLPKLVIGRLALAVKTIILVR